MKTSKEAPGDAAPVKVLVIDDEVGLRDMLKYSLGERGYDATCAASGEEGLREAKADDYDVVICDLMMPGLHGVDVLRELKEAKPETEVVMSTGYATLESAVDSMRLGAYDYVVKPYELDHLDMVVRRAAERRRLRKEVVTLESLSRMKSEFLANMSHELRTPLNSIIGYSSLLIDGTYGNLPSDQAEVVGRVLSSSQDLLTLINGVLDLSKLNSGMMPLYEEEFDLSDLAREVVETAGSLAVRKGISLAARAEEPIRLRADRTKTKQILVNLVGNAIKFTDSGGVEISVERGDEGDAVVKVSDTGPGIAAKDREVIFEEFRQLDGSSRREHGGTGLGLAIVRKLVELMGGAISVESELGDGSVFVVRLPAGRPASSEVSRSADAPLSAVLDEGDDRPLVLAIDDDPEVHRLLRDSLAKSSYRLAGALSGDEGIAMARRLRPFAITLDIMMPHRDGWTVLQTLKNDPDLRGIPVIVLSICENRTLGFSLGAEDYIVKPFRKGELLQKLETLRKGDPPRVLVVDGDPAVADSFRRALSGDGYEVEVAASGREALRWPGKVPDAVFLSLTLPDASGPEVLTALQGRPGWEGVPVIVLAPSDLSEAELSELERRVAMVVEKEAISVPKVVERLKERLRTIDQNRAEAVSHA